MPVARDADAPPCSAWPPADAVRVPCAIVLEAKALPASRAATGTIGTVGGGALNLVGADVPGEPVVAPATAARAGRRPARAAGWRGAVADRAGRRPARRPPAARPWPTWSRPSPRAGRRTPLCPGCSAAGPGSPRPVTTCSPARWSGSARSARRPRGRSPRRSIAPPRTPPRPCRPRLLRHAARGECIPQLADLLDAVAHGGAGPAGGLCPVPPGPCSRSGHCSGAGLLHGVLVGLAIAHSPAGPAGPAGVSRQLAA